MAQGFVKRNAIPLFVLACVAGGFVVAATLRPVDVVSPNSAALSTTETPPTASQTANTPERTPETTARSAGGSTPTRDATASSLWKAPPSPGTTLTRIAFGSCLRQDKVQPIWTPIIAAKPDLFLMMGDNVYGDVKSSDLRELKSAYSRQAAHPEFAKARAAMAMLATWDDHDYGANDGGAAFVHRDAARDVFRSFWAGSGTLDSMSDAGIYHARMFGPEGQRVQIIMLDTRSFRSPLTRDPAGRSRRGKYVPDPDPAKTILGAVQWGWLKTQLAQPADLRIVVSSIQVLADGHGWERWGNLPAERQRLFDMISGEGVGGVVFLSGDRHRAAIYRNADAGPYPFYEVTSSSLNFGFEDPAERGPFQLETMFGEINYGMLEIDWSSRSLVMTLHGPTGTAVRTQKVSLAALVAQ